MKTMILAVTLVAVAVLGSGCLLTDMVENRTRNELQQQGWQVSPRNPDVYEFVKFTPAEQLKAGVAPANVRYAITQAAGDLHPWLYGGAKVVDYGVLPIAGGLLTYQGYKTMSGGNSGDRTKTTTITANNGGQVNINNGPGTANQAGPSTTSTSSTTGL